MSLEHEDDVEQPNNSGEDKDSCDVLTYLMIKMKILKMTGNIVEL